MRFFNNRPLLITLAVALVLLICIVVLPTPEQVGGPQNIAGGAVSSTQSFFSRIVSSVGGFFSNLFHPSDMEEENNALKQEVALLQSQLQRMNELEQENERLAAALEYTQTVPEYEYIMARVSAKDPGHWFDVFTINVGYNDGVEVNDPVITPDGLVGRVTEVGGSWAKVMAIIDSRSSVSCLVERTRDNGIVSGALQTDDKNGECSMSYLPLEADLLTGDRVITNGLGGVFPRGLVVGEIKEVNNIANTGEKTVIIQPSVDFLHLEEVMIVKEKTADQSQGEAQQQGTGGQE